MSTKSGDHVNNVLRILDEHFEQDFLDWMHPTDLAVKVHLDERQLHQAIDFLIARGLAEESAEGIRYARVRLTPFGKEEYDRQTGNVENERIRGLLLSILAKSYAEQPDKPVRSYQLETELGLDANTVCMNLAIMARQGLVRREPRVGAGKICFHVYLTPIGKAIHDNPPKHVLFISHVALDRKIAFRLRDIVETSFPRASIFISSAPDVLMVGDPWVDKILSALQDTRAAVILATERGLSRSWVWFEAGAAWGRAVNPLCGCLGKQRKGNLPAPFGLYQAVNLDEPEGVEALFAKLEDIFGKAIAAPDFEKLAHELWRLNGVVEDEIHQETRSSMMNL